MASLSRLVRVLPKPAGVSETLRQELSRSSISREDQADLSRKGFYLATNGQLVSNRGEIVAKLTARGAGLGPEIDQ